MTEGLGIHIKDLAKNFTKREVIKDLNLDIEPGSFVSIVGPSGCGKSTLLRLIAGLENPTSGEVSLSPTAKRSFSFVFQEANLLPWRSVFENVLLPFELNSSFKNLSYEEKSHRVIEALKKVKLEEFAKLFPHELSGGMKMRVSLARALVSSPRLLLMDEPFAALDETTRFEMQNQLLELWKNEKMTIVFVTHSLFESTYLSERIIMLKGAGAKITLDQTLDLPKNRTEALRTSEDLNRIVRHLSERLKA
ncbi:ABC transporter ATP-binding protein [uncultured Bdellovibrio sp.]|uniref:ABC transporter ATP-binding protein n=1 Tax=Bdellovibrio sp. HCB-162 TaxID=3394234 RepID=UPI0025D89E72|nr:ABC transporter ATP-binding protein [uncultured Bdellovibrio sp.]